MSNYGIDTITNVNTIFKQPSNVPHEEVKQKKPKVEITIEKGHKGLPKNENCKGFMHEIASVGQKKFDVPESITRKANSTSCQTVKCPLLSINIIHIEENGKAIELTKSQTLHR